MTHWLTVFQQCVGILPGTVSHKNMFLLEFGSQENNVFVFLGQKLGRQRDNVTSSWWSENTVASFRGREAFFFFLPEEILWNF